MARNKDHAPNVLEKLEDFDAIAEDMLAKGIKYPMLMEANAYLFIAIKTALGGYAFKRLPDGSFDPSDLGVDSPGGLASARWLSEAVKKGYVKDDTPFDVARKLFADGEAGFYISGPWNVGFFDESGVNWAIDPLPRADQDAKPFMAARGLVANRFGKQLPLAQTFLTEYLASDKPMLDASEASSRLSAWLPIRSQVKAPLLKALSTAALNAEPMPSFPEMGFYWVPMNDALKLVMSQTGDPEEAFKNGGEKMRSAIKEG